MEQQVLSEDDRLLDQTLPIRFTIQNELLEFVIGRLEDYIKGYHEALEGMRVRPTPYATFAVDELREKYAVWFATLCTESRVDGEGLRGPMTEKDFRDFYLGQPQRVLAEIIAHLDYENVDEYLRELKEWFTVKPDLGETDETSGISVLSVPLAASLTRQAIADLFSLTQRTSV